jgi:hypothetical protein
MTSIRNIKGVAGSSTNQFSQRLRAYAKHQTQKIESPTPTCGSNNQKPQYLNHKQQIKYEGKTKNRFCKEFLI